MFGYGNIEWWFSDVFCFFYQRFCFKKNKQKSNGIVKAITQDTAVNETKVWYVNSVSSASALTFIGDSSAMGRVDV